MIPMIKDRISKVTELKLIRPAIRMSLPKFLIGAAMISAIQTAPGALLLYLCKRNGATDSYFELLAVVDPKIVRTPKEVLLAKFESERGTVVEKRQLFQANLKKAIASDGSVAGFTPTTIFDPLILAILNFPDVILSAFGLRSALMKNDFDPFHAKIVSYLAAGFKLMDATFTPFDVNQRTDRLAAEVADRRAKQSRGVHVVEG